MKYEFRYYHIFCLVNAGFLSVSGEGIVTKYVCSGDSVQAFQNIKFNNCSSVVSLYINGERNTLIARWKFENCRRNEILLPDYKERVFLNGNGTVSIHNVHFWDQAKYSVHCQMGEESMEDVVEIQVMAAPANDCIPTILHQESSLFASLKAHSCGNPVATLYWKGYGDVPNTREPVLKLNKRNQDVTYYACIEGPALTCVRNALNYCSPVTIEGNKSPPMLLETWDVRMACIPVGIVLSISFILTTAVILIRLKCRKNDSHDAHFMSSLQTNQQMTPHDDTLSGQHIDFLVKEMKILRNSIDHLRRLQKDSKEAEYQHSNEDFDDSHDAHFMSSLQTNQQMTPHDDTLSGQHIDFLVKEMKILRNSIDHLSKLQKDSKEAEYQHSNEDFSTLIKRREGPVSENDAPWKNTSHYYDTEK